MIKDNSSVKELRRFVVDDAKKVDDGPKRKGRGVLILLWLIALLLLLNIYQGYRLNRVERRLDALGDSFGWIYKAVSDTYELLKKVI